MKLVLSDINASEIIPGFQGRFVHMEGFTIAYLEVKAGSVLPEHSHVNEQSSQVNEGQFEFRIDGETAIYEAGQVAVSSQCSPFR